MIQTYYLPPICVVAYLVSRNWPYLITEKRLLSANLEMQLFLELSHHLWYIELLHYRLDKEELLQFYDGIIQF